MGRTKGAANKRNRHAGRPEEEKRFKAYAKRMKVETDAAWPSPGCDFQVGTHLTAEERNAIEDYARDLGVVRSELVRMILRSELKRWDGPQPWLESDD